MHLLLIFLAIFFTIFVSIKPIKLGRLNLDMATGSLLSLLFLYILGPINLETIKQGIIGINTIKPWEIIIIFFSVAYASISTDITGIFDYLSHKLAHWAKGNGLKLFLFFYLFACLLTAFTSNDIVILTLTPIIFYLGKHAKLNITPLLFAEFFGANTLSMLLYIGNPTNIIVGNALQMGFWDYSKVMWLPTIVATILNILLLWLFFKKQITNKYVLNKDSSALVRNWCDAILSTILMLILLICLSRSQKLNFPIWQITLFFGTIFIIEDIIFSIYYYLHQTKIPPLQLEKMVHLGKFPKEKNEFFLALKRMPWKILPFIICFFIMVQALNNYGVINYLASYLSILSQSLAGGIFSMGTISLVAANIINNQPMTILFSHVLINNNFLVSPTNLLGSAYALIIASNLGANITLIGALAGLMWKKILNTKGIEINYLNFLKTGIIITPIVFYLTLTTLYFVLK